MYLEEWLKYAIIMPILSNKCQYCCRNLVDKLESPQAMSNAHRTTSYNERRATSHIYHY